jgi:prevent-host-death family protein
MLVTVHEAKTHLSRLLARVEAGDEVVIGRAGKPVARLVAVTTDGPEPRVLGQWHGRVEFDAPLPEDILAAFATPE